MTRINANIKPEDLIDQHLIAEYREIIRIPNVLSSNGYNANRKYPTSFRLGTGHVLYFYDKIKFLHKRFLDIKQVMQNRKITNNIDDSPFIPFIDNTLYNDIHCTELFDANLAVIDRIIDRISTMKRIPTINGTPVSLAAYSKMLKIKYS